jgi:uncharacterized protein YbjT (DUF2867 family)
MPASRTIAVVGATGRLGAPLCDVLAERGHTVVPIARSKGVDIVSGTGLAEALHGVDIVIDTASTPSPDEAEATNYFTTATRNLQREGAAAGVQKMFVLSIIGTDQMRGGYGKAKIAHEREALAGPIPARIVRASQFYDFVGVLANWGTQDGVAFVQDSRVQPIDTRFLAETIADLLDDEAMTTVDVAGPVAGEFADFVRALYDRTGDSRSVQAVHNDDDPNQVAYDAGALVPGADAITGGPTFEEWLGRR